MSPSPTKPTSSSARISIETTGSPSNAPVHVSVSLGISGDAESDPLAVISGITEGTKSMEAQLRQSVARARELRYTWEEIGEALGVTRQSAWERFSDD